MKSETEQLRKLSKRFARQSLRWQRDMLKEKNDLYARNRYEGIAIGLRWASEDIAVFVKKL
jgi:hypothetical protein